MTIYYEHVSNFSQYSFQREFRSGRIAALNYIPIIPMRSESRLSSHRPHSRIKLHHRKASFCNRAIRIQRNNVHNELQTLLGEGKKIAFWGATGKGASFLNGFNLFDAQFPTVVDSDMNKVGRYVPRTAQLIRSPEYLKTNPVDIIIITTQWRAKDIFMEIKARSLPFERIMIQSNLSLTEYNGEDL